MKSNPQALMALQQANLALYFDCCHLLVNAEMNLARAGLESLDALRKPAQADPKVPGALPLTMLQQQVRVMQHLTEVGMDLQKEVGAEMQQAVANWQKAVAGTMTLPTAMNAAPLGEAMQKQFETYMQWLTPGTRR